MKNFISQEKVEYAIPVYKLKFPENSYNSNDVHFVIDGDTLQKALFLRVRGETIKFSSRLKKKRDQSERALKSDTAVLENFNTLSSDEIQSLGDKKQEHEGIGQLKMQGYVIRSCLKWLQEGEKPSKYFVI